MKKRVGDHCHLDELKIGQVAIVISVRVIDQARRRHLFDMGVIRGTRVKIKKMAPMGDPVDIELRGYELCISKDDLKNILVEVVKE